MQLTRDLFAIAKFLLNLFVSVVSLILSYDKNNQKVPTARSKGRDYVVVVVAADEDDNNDDKRQ